MESARMSIGRFEPLSSTLSILLCFGYFSTLIFPKIKPYVVLVPAKASFALWTCITSSFIVRNPVEILMDVIGLLFVGKIVEPIWGGFELIKFLILVAGVTGFATFAVAYTTFVLGRSAVALYIQISGFHGLLGAMLVALKQVAPDHVLIFFDLFRIRAEWLASIYVLVGIPFGLLYRPMAFYPFLFFGTYFSWFYLRFLQTDPHTQLKGDPSPSFRFASFFPEFMRNGIDPVASFCSKLFNMKPKQQPPLNYIPSSSSVFNDSQDQTRRRERGLRALDAKLSGMNGGGPSRKMEEATV